MKNLSFLLMLSVFFNTSCIYAQKKVYDISVFKNEGGRPEISPDGKRVAYHKKLKDGYYDIFICNIDGEGDTCLTCDHPSLPNKHIGQPSWHPNGEWIVFQAEMNDHVLSNIGALAAPGIGYHNDVYLINLKTGDVFRLTHLKTKMRIGDKTPSSGILQPHFSENGKTISWSQRYDDGGDWGKWKIVTADFNAKPPFISNLKTYTPDVNKGYYESNDFLNDSTLLICGNLEPNQKETGIDIYTLNLNSGKTSRLTHSIDFFDECPHPNKQKDKICYLSTQGYENKKNKWWWNWVKGEFWLMDVNGNNKKQITHFNTPGYMEYTGKRVIPAYIAWSPKGDYILLGVVEEIKKRKLIDKIYKITLN